MGCVCGEGVNGWRCVGDGEPSCNEDAVEVCDGESNGESDCDGVMSDGRTYPHRDGSHGAVLISDLGFVGLLC